LLSPRVSLLRVLLRRRAPRDQVRDSGWPTGFLRTPPERAGFVPPAPEEEDREPEQIEGEWHDASGQRRVHPVGKRVGGQERDEGQRAGRPPTPPKANGGCAKAAFELLVKDEPRHPGDHEQRREPLMQPQHGREEEKRGGPPLAPIAVQGFSPPPSLRGGSRPANFSRSRANEEFRMIELNWLRELENRLTP